MELKKRYKAVFFDLGGTLRIALSDEPYMRHARRKMAEIAGIPENRSSRTSRMPL